VPSRNLGRDEDARALVLHHVLVRARLGRGLDGVFHARAAALLHTDAHADHVATLGGDDVPHAGCRGVGHAHHGKAAHGCTPYRRPCGAVIRYPENGHSRVAAQAARR
jgi:hypothetical protein